jgi:hypothetical protein
MILAHNVASILNQNFFLIPELESAAALGSAILLGRRCT